jgi:hypothetical protein
MKSVSIFKSRILFLFVSLMASQMLSYGQSARDVFNNSETQILFLGVDFTKAKFIDFLTENQFDLRDKVFPGVNETIITEMKKFTISNSFHKSFVDHDMGPVSNRNSKINAEDIKSTNTADFHKFTPADIDKLISGFDFGEKKGVGLLFICEGASKSLKAAAFWVTLVDMRSHRILMTERVEGKLSGMGMKGAVLGAFKNVLEEIDKQKYSEWKTKYNNS